MSSSSGKTGKNKWDCSSGPSLISSYDGTPTAYGAGLRAHLLAGS
ncbi:Uncharacterised protein [Mycobacterium tuberculosis]|nr:Uncharacterised protein [Mycobacterium tuberculosis]